MIDQLLKKFDLLDRECIAQLKQEDHSAAVRTLFDAAIVNAKLKWSLAEEGGIAASGLLKRFIEGDFQIQNLLTEINFEQGMEDVIQPHWIADTHLNRVLDFENPDWPLPINERLLKLDVLITEKPLPAWVTKHFKSVRRCYGLEMYDLVWISLRAFIEAASFEWLVQHRAVRRNRGVLDFAERKIRVCLREVATRGPISGRQMQQISDIVDRANQIIHSKHDIRNPTEPETFQAIRAVIRYINRLLSQSA